MICRIGKVHYSIISLFFSFFFFCWLSLFLVFWSRLGVKILEKFVRLILQDRFRFVNKPFCIMVKFKFLARFPMDYLTHIVASRLILFVANLIHLLIIWLIVIICCLLRVFHTSVSWCFLNGVCVTASLLRSLELFSVFWPISNMQ